MESRIIFKIYIAILTILSETASEHTNYINQTSKLLSRRKRFLLFPEGSSFQLVFCCQTSAVITIGDIFLYGNTAAMAWSLPTDPKILYRLAGYKKEASQRADMVNNIFYLDKEGKVIAKVPYKAKLKYLPVFSKRSVEEDETFKQKVKNRIDRIKMHEGQHEREYLKKDHLDRDTKDFHRSSRVELFEKLEKVISAIGQDGRQCVLYKLCEAAQAAPQQGTFLQEFYRVIFTLPKGIPFDVEDHREYDLAHTPTDNCRSLYPGCDNVEIPMQISL